MSKQWGHGFYKGVEASQSNSGTLEGLWFHSFEGKNVQWQGIVDRDLKNGNYLVQLYSWIDGSPTSKEIVSFEKMKGWKFYQNSKAMRYEWNKMQGYSQDDFEWQESLLKMINER